MGVGADSDGEDADPLASGSEVEEVDPLAGSDDEDDDGNASDDSDNVSVASSSSSTHSVKETQAQLDRKAAFFSTDDSSSSAIPTSFAAMNLSRPILRNITALNYTSPTPIQARTIPLALLGRDILGSAVTGSGKTAAFMIPVLERLLYREKGKGGKGSASRVLVLCPTRELAVQAEAVGKALSMGMDIRFALLVGEY
jgi:ATP-dependent RNA helicase DDX27